MKPIGIVAVRLNAAASVPIPQEGLKHPRKWSETFRTEFFYSLVRRP